MRWQDCERFIEITSMYSVLTIFIILLVIRLIAELWLDGLNRKEVLNNAHSVPDAFREFTFFTIEQHIHQLFQSFCPCTFSLYIFYNSYLMVIA